MTDPSPRGLERSAFTAFAAVLLSPIVAQGLWRPLEHVFGAAGTAQQITGSALVIGAMGALVRPFVRDAARPLLALPGVLAALALSAGLSLGLAGLGALLPAALLSGWLHGWLPPRLPAAFDGLAHRNRGLAALYGLVALSSVLSLARVTIFIGDPTAVEDQALPGEKFTEVHSCLTAYVRASALARQGVDDLYADPWWYGSLGLPPRPAGEEDPYAPFGLDNFNYPPTFLLLISPLAPLDSDFLAQRALWFGLSGLCAAWGLWVVARWIGGPAEHRILLLAPIFLASMPVLLALQIGNFHLSALVLTLVGMVALDQRRTAIGGALFATAILSKISPGLLGVVLLVQRRARDAAIVASFGALLLLLSVLAYGTNPLLAFLSTALPHLSSGAAFPHISTPDGIATNIAPFGFAFKLKVLGLDVGDPWRLGKLISRVYTLGLLALTVASARRRGDRRDQAMRWMALLVLAALQSPFSAAYATLSLLWATTLLSVEVRRWWEAVALVVLWPVILIVPSGLDLAQKSVLGMAQTTLIIGLSAWLALRPPPPDSMSVNG